VARVALEEGLAVRATLPMPRDLYAADFDTASRAEFESLLADPRVSVEEIPLPPGLGTEDVSAPGPARDRLYARLGDYLARRSNLLLVLWDGGSERLEGGTADVLLRYLASGRSAAVEATDLVIGHDEDANPCANIACWVPVARTSGNEPGDRRVRYLASTGVPGRVLAMDGPPPEFLVRLGDIATLAAAGRDAPPSSRKDGLMETVPPPADGELRRLLEAIDFEYRRSDALAIANQKQSDRVFRLFALMAGLMALIFLTYAKLAPIAALLIAYLVLFAAGLLSFLLIRNTHWFASHLLHRAAAEMMRIRFYTSYAGVGGRLDIRRLMALTGIENFAGFGWLSDVARVGEPLAADGLVHAPNAAAIVQAAWVEDQGRYFHKRVHSLHQHRHRLERIKTLLFGLSFIGALALVFFRHRLEEIGYGEHRDVATLLIFLLGLLPLWLGIWEIFQNKMATRELLWQYRNQGLIFANATETIATCTSTDAKRAVIADLGERSLFETFLWTIHRFHREHEPPAAG